MKITLIGPLLVFFYSLLPLVLVGAFGDFTTGFAPRSALIVGALLSIPWSLYLKNKGTEIEALKIPAWIWTIVLLVLILLGYIY